MACSPAAGHRPAVRGAAFTPLQRAITSKRWSCPVALNERTARKRSTMLFTPTELLWRQQERNQIRHLLDSDGGFQALRHQREAGAGNLRDVAAEHRFGHALGAFQGEARGTFVGDEAVERATI